MSRIQIYLYLFMLNFFSFFFHYFPQFLCEQFAFAFEEILLFSHIPYFPWIFRHLKHHISTKIWTSPFYCLLMCLNGTKWVIGKQCRPWLDASFCSVWSRSTLFAQICFSESLVTEWILYQIITCLLFACVEIWTE